MDLYEFCRIVGDEEESFEFLQANGLIRQDPPGDKLLQLYPSQFVTGNTT